MAAPQVLVIGGGITGLSAAYELSQGGLRPVLLEPRAHLGGVIRTEAVEGCVLEQGPDSFLSAKPAALELIRELGMGGQVIGSNDASRITYLVRNGRLVPLPDGLLMMVPTRILPVALSPLLGWGTKLRMGLEYFRRPPAAPPADRSVSEFIRGHYGEEAVEYLAEPLLAGVYGGSVDKLSVNSVLTRFVELESQYGSLTRGVLAARRAAKPAGASAPLFQTLRGGLGSLVAELERRLRTSTAIHQTAAETIEAAPGGYRVRCAGGWLEAPAVIFACPAWQAAQVLAGLDGRISELLAGVEYSSSLTLALGFQSSACGALPPGFGFLVPRRERKTLVACTFVAAKFTHRVPPGMVVLRCFLGGAGGEQALARDDGSIVEDVLAELHALLGWRAQPAFTRLTRWPKSMAQYTVGHARRMEALRERLSGYPGLHLAGNAYEGIGIPDCVRLGRAAARAVRHARAFYT